MAGCSTNTGFGGCHFGIVLMKAAIHREASTSVVVQSMMGSDASWSLSSCFDDLNFGTGLHLSLNFGFDLEG